MKQLVLNIYYWFMFILVTLLGLILLPLFLFVYRVFLGRTIDFSIRWAISIYGWILVTIVPFFAPVQGELRTGKLPLPAILVANHNSAIDPYLFGALLIDAGFFSTWAFKIPIYGFFMRLAGYVDASQGWEKVCQKSTELLRSGTSLIIWPEGHRSPDGRLGRFKNGAFALAVQTGYPLLPVCILGSGKFLAPGKRIFSPSRIKIILLDPVYPDMKADPQQEIIRLRTAVQEVIRETLQEDKLQLPTIPNPTGVERGVKC